MLDGLNEFINGSIVKVDDNHYKLQSTAAGTDTWADVAGSEIVIPESTKVEASTTNGNIKVDGEEVKEMSETTESEEVLQGCNVHRRTASAYQPS